MDNSMQSQSQGNDGNIAQMISDNERRAAVDRFMTNAGCRIEFANRADEEAFKQSKGNRMLYMKVMNSFYQSVRAKLQSIAAQQQQQQQQQQQNASATGNLVRPTQPTNIAQNYRYITPTPTGIPTTRMVTQQVQVQSQQPMNRMNQPMSFPSATSNLNEYSSFQNRFPTATQNHPLRPRTATSTTNPISFPSPTVSTDPNSTFISTNSTAPVNSLPRDHLLHQVLGTGTNVFAARMGLQPRGTTTNLLNQPMRPATPTANVLRAPSTSIVTLPPTAQTSTVPLATNLPAATTNMLNTSIVQSVVPTPTPIVNRPMAMPENELIELITFLKENVHQLNYFIEQVTRSTDGSNERNQREIPPDQLRKIRGIQEIQQKIHQFVTNPTQEGLEEAKKYRELLKKFLTRKAEARSQSSPATAPAPAPTQPSPPVVPVPSAPPVSAPIKPTLSVFDQCAKSAQEFLQRDPKDRRLISKRYLEPLNDVINGVPHKILRLDFDQNGKHRHRSTKTSTFLSLINDEIHRLPSDIYSIENFNSSRTMKISSEDKSGLTLRCKLISHSNPILPPLILHLSSSYPEQAPVILSLTKSPTPKLDFADGNQLLEKISNIFVANLFQLPREHTITDILNIWRQSVQTAL